MVSHFTCIPPGQLAEQLSPGAQTHPDWKPFPLFTPSLHPIAMAGHLDFSIWVWVCD